MKRGGGVGTYILTNFKITIVDDIKNSYGMIRT